MLAIRVTSRRICSSLACAISQNARASASITSLPLASAETVDRIAAVVNAEVITLSEVYDLASDFILEREGEIQGRLVTMHGDLSNYEYG